MLPLSSARYILIVADSIFLCICIGDCSRQHFSVYLHRKFLKFIFFLLIFGFLPNVIYLKCNLKDVLEVVAILSGDTANKLLN